MSHDPLCESLYQQRIPTPAEHCLACSVIFKVRQDEREQARQRVLDAAEHNVKIKGITVAVILRSVAAQAAEGAA